MKIFDPSKHQAKKRFGQNFLHDGNIIDRIVSGIRATEGDNIIEIGPGLGAITKQLLPIAKKMNVIELDRDIIPKLKFNCDGLGVLTIHETDALKFDYDQLCSSEDCKVDQKGESEVQINLMRIVGNLPYNISTPILFHLFKYADKIKDMHFMLQKEVVERMVANPGSKTYGRLSVMTQSVCDARMLFIVPPTAFTPAPKVESAIVWLAPRKEKLDIQDRKLFAKIVTEAFNQRRKTLRNTWRKRIGVEDIESLGIDASLRPESISLDEYVRVSNFLSQVNESQAN
ncbi:MAG: 16S rRNA (adenine1518-N6/adenine1519-N6)-dimethyltransferase [Polaribacter sp.]|jgi:16S rRNA (adenine1518-N6/adenine1519-N6)-dimethyltransferase